MKIRVLQIIVLGGIPIWLFVYGLLTLYGIAPTEKLEFFEVNGFILMAYGMILLLFFIEHYRIKEVKD